MLDAGCLCVQHPATRIQYLKMKITSELKDRAVSILKSLRKTYPDAHCELNFSTSLELAVAAILSAQCTDKRVNMVTPALFAKYKTAADWAAVPQSVLEEEIRSTGFFRNKTKSIRELGKVLVDEFDGELPDDLDTLIKLPGIGRKTANVLLISAFNQPGITVDTHCKRVSHRLGFTDSQNPDRIEFDLKAIVPRRNWGTFSHCMVFHGRYCCHSRKPACATCPLADRCPSAADLA